MRLSMQCEMGLNRHAADKGAAVRGLCAVRSSVAGIRQTEGSMIIDIREDVPELLDYVRRRVDEHVAKAAKVKKLPPVKMIEFGFEFGQANWVALVFDTRPNAKPDGEWTREIDDVM